MNLKLIALLVKQCCYHSGMEWRVKNGLPVQCG